MSTSGWLPWAPFPAIPFPRSSLLPSLKTHTIPNGAIRPESKAGFAGSMFPLLDWTEAAPQALPETRGSPEPQGSPSAPPLTQMRPLKLGVGGKLGSWPSLPWVSRLPGLSHTHGHLWAPAASAQHCLSPSSDPVCRAMGAGSPSQARHREGPERVRPL